MNDRKADNAEESSGPRVVQAHGLHSLWNSGVDAAKLPDEDSHEVDPERFPDGRITAEDARLRTMVDTAIRRVTMLCVRLKRAESSKSKPDQVKLDVWNSLQEKARSDRRSLDFDDHGRLESVIESYRTLAEQLEREGR